MPVDNTVGRAYRGANTDLLVDPSEITVYLLFERSKQKLCDSIAVARFNLDWLAEGRDRKQYLPK